MHSSELGTSNYTQKMDWGILSGALSQDAFEYFGSADMHGDVRQIA